MRPPSTASLFASEFFVALWSAFIAVWPQILTNLISDILAKWFNIETSDGTKLVITLALATLLMYGVFRGVQKNSQSSLPGSALHGNFKMQILLQGSLFSLAIVLSRICEGLLTGPFTLDKILQILAALIPALEGTIARRILARESDNLHYEIMDYIDLLLQRNPRATQRTIEGHIREYRGGTLLPADVIRSLVRTQMVEYVDREQYYRRRREDLVVLDTFREPDNWKLLRPQAA